ncbi:carbohydrate ABC transporter permease [Actinopolymorpha alba]|uniref:carbohydrate ABC transporter permease n=1 Tax=Actinopolymorpha alba TaxID=533267 RepID=UPI00036DCB35|nr:sugar ABC transporter permease [Actinopolymorpha alba]
MTRRWGRHGGIYLLGYLFLLPAAAVYLVFVLYPLARSVQLSLTDWDGARPVATFVGLANYARLLHDGLFWRALGHNFVWVGLGSAVALTLSLLLALLVWNKPQGFTVFRTVYFMPQILPAVIVGIVWSWIYHPTFGILNRGLDALGLHTWAKGWLGDPGTALYAVLAASIWATVGLAFVLFSAALQGVDTELLDAAQVDGANTWQRVRHVLVPQLANAVTLVAVLLLVHGFQAFDHVWIMTRGGPDDSTQLLATYTYQKAFMDNEVGYGSTLSLVLTAICLATAVITVRARERERA